MTLGEVPESITAEAGVLAVDTASATVSTVVDRTFVEDMPLNGRSFMTLILLTPGAVGTHYCVRRPGASIRRNVVPGVSQVLYGSQYLGGKIFNKNAFTPPVPGTRGNFGRNVLRGFGATQADVAFQRQFHLTEQVALGLRSEFFNIFNHPNFGPSNNMVPTHTAPNPLFVYSTST